MMIWMASVAGCLIVSELRFQKAGVMLVSFLYGSKGRSLPTSSYIPMPRCRVHLGATRSLMEFFALASTLHAGENVLNSSSAFICRIWDIVPAQMGIRISRHPHSADLGRGACIISFPWHQEMAGGDGLWSTNDVFLVQPQ